MQNIDGLEEMIKHLLTQIDRLKDDSEGGAQVINNRPPYYYKTLGCYFLSRTGDSNFKPSQP